MVTPTPTLPPAPAAADVCYPESDGQPVAETDVHRTLMFELIGMLQTFFRDDPHVYISGNLFLYYQEGDPRRVVAPDVFVVPGIPNEPRRTYKLWEEEVVPAVVFELTSRSTRREDLHSKYDLYERLGVTEYFLFDPLGEYLRPPLQGYRWHQGPVPAAGGRWKMGRCGVRRWGWRCTHAARSCDYMTRRVNDGCRRRRKRKPRGAQRRSERR